MVAKGNTAQIYTREIHRFLTNIGKIWGITETEMTPRDAMVYTKVCFPDLIRSPSLARVHFWAIRRYVRHRWSTMLPIYVRIADSERMVKEIPEETIREIFQFAKNHPGGTLLKLLCQTVISIEGAIALRVEDFHFERSILFWEGSGIALLGDLKYELARLAMGRSPSHALFSIRKDGSPMSRRTLENLLTRACQKLGIDMITPKVLKDCYALRSLQSGVQPKKLAEMMGYKSSRPLKRFVHEREFRQVS